MFRNRRRQADSLPTSSNVAPSVFHFPTSSNGPGSVADGSGRAIRMEAPVARAWKKATTYTKGSYYCLIACILLMYFGYRWLRWHHASIHLICHTEECTFTITPRGWAGSHKVQFPRHQLVRAESMKVDTEGNFVALSSRLDDFHDIPNKKGPKKKTTSYKGPDKYGHYPSYRLVLRESSNKPDNTKASEQTGDSVDGSAEPPKQMEDTSLKAIKPFMEETGEGEEFSIIIRKFHIYQSRRRVKTTVQKIDSYIKRRRHKLTVKENCAPSWQGILMLVLGIFGLLLTLLIGQFWEEAPPPNRRQSGPGTRTRATPDYTGKRPNIAASGRRKGY